MTRRIAFLTLNSCLLLAALVPASVARGAEEGLVACWDFDEGKGNVLHDRSGNNNHGKIHGAKWVKSGKGFALKFDGDGDYVDCGDNPALRIRGDMTITAWVMLMASPYPNRNINWYVVGCEEYEHSGFMLRIDGETGKLTYRSSQENSHQYIHSYKSLENNTYYHVAVVKKGEIITYFVDAEPDVRFRVKDPGQGAVAFKISDQEQSFSGLMDDLRIYGRALSEQEMVRQYNQEAEAKGKRPRDTSWFGRFKLTPYFCPDRNEVAADVDFRGLLPLPEGARIRAELARVGAEKALQLRRIEPRPHPGHAEAAFALTDLAHGEYEIRAILTDARGVRSEAAVAFQYPPPPPQVSAPETKVVGPLPKPLEPTGYHLELCDGGGFKILIKGEVYPVESIFSYPHGGENTLLASQDRGPGCEPSWKVTTRKVGAKEYRVLARGRYYAIERRISLQQGRVSISDTITNLADEDAGIIINNRLNIRGNGLTTCYLGGVKCWGSQEALHNPTVFVAKKKLGLGFVAIDDVYVVHGKLYGEEACAGISDDMFGLGPNASYTMTWSVYLVGSDDYFDFINALRRDLGLNGKTLDGGYMFMPRHKQPPKETVDLIAAKYLSLPCLSHCADDPGVSIEGIEFIDFPKEREAVKKTLDETKKRFPHVKVMFHIAHSLYATNKPERYADSRVMDKDGKQVVCSTTYPHMAVYFSKERLDQGWDWYIFYPTLDNSFGKAMLRAADVMMDEIGVTGVWADGLMLLHCGNFTYERWDGHTVEIDPKTKTVKRKFGSLHLLCQDAIMAYCERIASKGGDVICDSGPGTLTFARKARVAAYPFESNRDKWCRKTHLAPFPTALGYIRSKPEPQVYRDIEAKLNWGVLYYYYGGKLGRSSILSRMYPITIEEIHSGFVKGRERLVTARSGAYGWPGDNDLHFAFLSDARGVLVPHNFLTTVDRAGVRTEIALREHEMVVLEKIPVTVQCKRPVNLVAQEYNGKAIQLVLNGNGEAKVVVKDGDFPVRPHAAYLVKTDTVTRVTADAHGTLSCRTLLDGQLRLRIESADTQ